MKDFAFRILHELLKTLKSQGFLFFTLDQYYQLPVNSKAIILRHDVEKHYKHALTFAQIQHELGIKGSFYFRLFQVASNEEVIKQIAALGYEIGYHYDDLSECRGDYEKAIQRFEKNLNYLRQFGPVTTMTMEGTPRSKYDNRMLWLGRLEEMRDERMGEDEMRDERMRDEEINNSLLTTHNYTPNSPLNTPNSPLPTHRSQLNKHRYEKAFVAKLSDSEGESAETQTWLDF